MSKNDNPQQIIIINGPQGEPPRSPADWAAGCLIIIIGIGVAIALIIGAF